ncbi:reverse transcriptase [Tanacetum coccineum]
MAPTTRIASTSHNNDEVLTREYLDAQLSEMQNLITTLGIQQNEMLNNGGGRQATQFGRLEKVEFPKFQGDDVRGWVFKCDQFFLIDNTPNEEKVKIVSVHLYDKALLWHRQFISNNGENVGWEVYKTAIIQRFGSIFEDPMSALKNAKYDKNAKEFQNEFDTLLCRVTITILEAVKKKNKPVQTSNVNKFGTGGYYGYNNKQHVLPLPASTIVSFMVLDDEEKYEGEFVDVEEELVEMPNNEGGRIVTMVGRRQLMTISECKDLQWQLKRETFTTDVMLLPLGGCDMVLGIQWLSTFGDIKCNFKELKMQFVYNNKKLCLKGSKKAEEHANEREESLHKILDMYADVFEVPQQLSPIISHDHKILLMPNTQPVNIRPYRHPRV